MAKRRTMSTPGVPTALIIAVFATSPLAAQSPSSLERGVLAEMNLVRANPSTYAKHLEPMLDWFDGQLMYRPGSDVGIRTSEGRAAVREAIAFLRRQRSVPALEWSPGLWRAARDHARDLGPSGATGHRGSDGSTADQRMNRHGRWLGSAAENIDFGNDDPRRVVIALIIDDGVADRGHRVTMFDPSLRVAGVGCGRHEEYRHLCVIDYAARYEEAERR